VAVAIIDGDVVAYQACRSRFESFEEKPIQLDENGRHARIHFTKEEDRRYLEESWAHFKVDLEVIREKLFCDESLVAVKGMNNFRNLLYPEYKIHRHRDPQFRNEFVPIMRELAVAEELAVPADGCEADDLIRIWAEQCRREDVEYVVCSIDKDLRCIPGLHFYIKRDKERLDEVTEREAMQLYYAQLLKGDGIDNIPGIPGVGLVKAARHLAECENETDFQEAVLAMYVDFYDDAWRENLLFTGRMIHLMRWPGDYFDLSSWPGARDM